MAYWSISGNTYHIYFPDCPLFLDFLLYWPNPLFVVTVLLFMMFFWHILHWSFIQFRRTTAVQIWRVYQSSFLLYKFSFCSYFSSVRQIFWCHCCGWNNIYLYFDVIFCANLSLYLLIIGLFPLVIFKVLKYWLLCEHLSLLINWKCSIKYTIVNYDVCHFVKFWTYIFFVTICFPSFFSHISFS